MQQPFGDRGIEGGGQTRPSGPVEADKDAAGRRKGRLDVGAAASMKDAMRSGSVRCPDPAAAKNTPGRTGRIFA